MRSNDPNPKTTWLKTDHTVVSINASMWNHLRAVESALRRGVAGIADSARPGFYEIETGDCWYYIHIPARIARVYLVAAGQKPPQVSQAEQFRMSVSA